MKHLFFKLTNLFRKPQLTGYLTGRGNKGAMIRISKVSLEQCIVIIYAMVVRIEAVMHVDRRFILNKVLALDTAAKKDKKAQEKEVRRQIYGNKK